MTIAERSTAEEAGGRLPVYVKRERACVVTLSPPGTLACFYCGFDKGGGHDMACRYVWWADKLDEQGGTDDVTINVPVGGVRASESFF